MQQLESTFTVYKEEAPTIANNPQFRMSHDRTRDGDPVNSPRMRLCKSSSATSSPPDAISLTRLGHQEPALEA